MGSINTIKGLEVVSIAEFVAMLEGVKGSTFITFVSETFPKVSKACPFKGVRKIQSMNATLGYIYANAIERQAEREGVEVGAVKQHPWGDLNENRTMRVHRDTGEQYMNVMVGKSLWVEYRDENGNVIDKAAIAPFLPKKSGSSTQENLEKKIVVRDFKFSGIISVAAWGKQFIVRQLDTVAEMALQAAEGKPEDVDAELV